MAVISLRVERIETVEGLTALRPEWQELAAAHSGGLPFATWEWNASWWLHFQAQRFSVRDRLFTLAVRTDSGELVGVAPLMLTERPGAGPLRARILQFFGADPNITELRGVVCDPAREREVYAALLDALRACADEWDWMVWLGLRAQGEPEKLVMEQPGFMWVRAIPDYVLRPTGSWEEFKSTRPRNIKESLRKCYNSLKRDNHEFTLTVARSREEVVPAMDHFFRLHGARAGQGSMSQHSNVFETTTSRSFLADVCQRLAERDQVRIFQLRIGGEVVTTRIGFALGDTLYLYYSGFDPAWGKYSVMTTTVAEALKYAISEGFKVVNLSSGNDVSKTRWEPEEIIYREVFHLSPAPRARRAHALYQQARQVLENERVLAVARRLLGRSAE